MVRRREDTLDRAELRDGTEVHHRDRIGEIAHDREIVRDEDERGAARGLDLGQEIHDRHLHRDVERGHRLIGHDHVGIAGERACDRGALLLAAR